LTLGAGQVTQVAEPLLALLAARARVDPNAAAPLAAPLGAAVPPQAP
jgi:hypothetical protein